MTSAPSAAPASALSAYLDEPLTADAASFKHREIRGKLAHVRFFSKPGWLREQRDSGPPSASKRAGKRFEARVLDRLKTMVEARVWRDENERPLPLLIHQFIRYCDANGWGFAEPEAYLVGPREVVLFEVKLTDRETAWTQVEGCYAPLLEALYARPVRSAIIARALRGRPSAPLYADVGAFVRSEARRGVVAWRL